MKKISSMLLALLLLFQPISFSAWDDTAPAGTSNASDIDANVIANNAALEATFSGITGFSNLKVTASGSTTTVTVTADMLLLQASASIAHRITSVSEAIAITTSGASGLVTSLSEAADAWYYVWIARKSSDGTVNGYLSTTTSLTTFLTQVDSGYDQAALVSVVRNASSDFVNFTQTGKWYSYNVGRTGVSGNVGTSSWVSFDTTNFVPSALSTYAFGSSNFYTGAGMTNNNADSVSLTAYPQNTIWSNGNFAGQSVWQYEILTSNTLYWVSSAADQKIIVHGFYLNKL